MAHLEFFVASYARDLASTHFRKLPTALLTEITTFCGATFDIIQTSKAKFRYETDPKI